MNISRRELAQQRDQAVAELLEERKLHQNLQACHAYEVARGDRLQAKLDQAIRERDDARQEADEYFEASKEADPIPERKLIDPQPDAPIDERDYGISADGMVYD